MLQKYAWKLVVNEKHEQNLFRLLNNYNSLQYKIILKKKTFVKIYWV